MSICSPLSVSITIKPWLKLGTHMFDSEGSGDRKLNKIKGILGTMAIRLRYDCASL